MMGGEAGIDELGLAGLGIIDRQHAGALVERSEFRGWMIRPLLAESRLVLLVAECRRHPDPALAVDHRVVIIEMRGPDLLLAPVGRRSERPFHRGVARSE